jgi:ketosteroid isomerase-like protein
MSEDVELLRRLTVIYNRGEFDTLREYYTADIVVDAGDLWPASGPVHGIDRVLAEFASILATFERVEVIAERYIERPDGIVVPSRWCGTMPGSNSVIEQSIVVVYRLREGRVESIRYFGDLEGALAAAEGGPPTVAEARDQPSD